MSTQNDTTARDPNIARWRQQAAWSLTQARRLRTAGDEIGAAIVATRGETRAAAADVLTTADSAHAASTLMLEHAWRLRQRDVSWADPDGSCLCYVRARTWQDCARQLDPTLPEVQPYWD